MPLQVLRSLCDVTDAADSTFETRLVETLFRDDRRYQRNLNVIFLSRIYNDTRHRSPFPPATFNLRYKCSRISAK